MQSSSIDIRRLGPTEIPLVRELNALFGSAFDDPGSYAAAPPSDAYLADLLAKEHFVILGALLNGHVVGGLVAYELDKFEQTRREIYVYDLAVDEPHRRRGIATGLLGHLCGIARVRNAWAVFVQADHGDDPAIALYTKLGRREDVIHFDIEIGGAGRSA